MINTILLHMKFLLFYLLVLTSSILPAFSQPGQLQAGVKLMCDLTFYHGGAPGGGVQMVHQMARHGGIESGLYLQQRTVADLMTGSGVNLYQTKIISWRLQFPVLYRYSSRVINFSLGPMLDIPVAKQAKTGDPDPALKNYKVYGITLMTVAGVSRSFYIAPKWILEPEITFNYLTGRHDGGIGLNLAVRRQLTTVWREKTR